MSVGLRAVPKWRGFVVMLIALVMVLGIDLRPASAEDETWVYYRSDVLEAWEYGGPGVHAAAEVALAGSDADVQTFMSVDMPRLEVEDLRVQAATFLASGGPAVRSAADTALSGGEEELHAFLDNDFTTAYEEDQRVQVAQIMAFGSPGVKRAATLRSAARPTT